MNWRNLLERLAGSNESAQRTAAAFAFGTFLSFSPFLGFQVATGMAVAFLLRLNRPAVLIGLCTNLPWIMIPWYSLTTYVGSVLVGEPMAADLGERLSALLDLPVYRLAFWQRAYHIALPFLWSFIIGSTLGAIVVGIVAYVVTVPLLARLKTEAVSSDDRPSQP